MMFHTLAHKVSAPAPAPTPQTLADVIAEMNRAECEDDLEDFEVDNAQ